DWNGWNQAPTLNWCRPLVRISRSSKVNRFLAMVRLLPLLLPANPICAWGFEAALPPTTTAPTGRPNKNPGTLAAGVPGVGSPVKKYPARENPTRATFTVADEKP